MNRKLRIITIIILGIFIIQLSNLFWFMNYVFLLSLFMTLFFNQIFKLIKQNKDDKKNDEKINS